MAIIVYPALVTGDQTQGYRAELVDFQAAPVAGENLAALLPRARALLQTLLQDLVQAGAELPVPTPVEALSERLQSQSAALLLVDAQMEETPVRVNISIGEGLLKRLDTAAEAQNMTRSGYIAAAVRHKLGAGDGSGASVNAGLREELSELGRKLNQALGPDSTFNRAVAELDERVFETIRTLGQQLGARRPPPGPRQEP
jgi:predicted transcriptional regulator/predicted RNase H-like HicB family nuclease